VSNVEITTDAEGTVTGNTYDKYNTTNPVAKRLQAGFERDLAELFRLASPASLLDVGCGEAEHTHKWAQQLGDKRVVGIDLEDATLQKFWETRTAPNLEYKILKAENMPFEDNEFDVASAIEVLEHVPDPAHTIAEMARVAKTHLLVSVPREPIWRAVNMARGAYIKDLGNTPGHLNHWSKRSFIAELSKVGTVTEARSPFPWTMLLVRVHGA
jgi:ubiquinone/menaquinone biosynthesis C-methylase UbiE